MYIRQSGKRRKHMKNLFKSEIVMVDEQKFYTQRVYNGLFKNLINKVFKPQLLNSYSTIDEAVAAIAK